MKKMVKKFLFILTLTAVIPLHASALNTSTEVCDRAPGREIAANENNTTIAETYGQLTDSYRSRLAEIVADQAIGLESFYRSFSGSSLRSIQDPKGSCGALAFGELSRHRFDRSLFELETTHHQVDCGVRQANPFYFAVDQVHAISDYFVQVFPRSHDYHGRPEKLSCSIQQIDRQGIRSIELIKPVFVQQVSGLASPGSGAFRVEICAQVKWGLATREVLICSRLETESRISCPRITIPPVSALFLRSRWPTLREYFGQFISSSDGHHLSCVMSNGTVLDGELGPEGNSDLPQITGNGIEMGH